MNHKVWFVWSGVFIVLTLICGMCIPIAISNRPSRAVYEIFPSKYDGFLLMLPNIFIALVFVFLILAVVFLCIGVSLKTKVN